MACEVVTLYLALIAKCTLSPPSSPTLQACASLYQSYCSRFSPLAMLERDFAAAWKVVDTWSVWWSALPARLSAHAQDLEDYILAYNTQEYAELAADLESRFNYLIDAGSCKLTQGDAIAYPDPAQLNCAPAFGAGTPTPSPTVRQVAQKAASACQTLQTKMEGLVSSAEKGQLARRGGTALYKGIKCASCAVAGLRTALVVAHCAVLSQSPPSSLPQPTPRTIPTIPPVALTRMNSLLERSNARIATMEWSSVMDTWTEMCKVLDKYINHTS